MKSMAMAGAGMTAAHLIYPSSLSGLGLPAPLAVGSLRLTLGRSNTKADVERVGALLPAIVARLRAQQSLASA